MRVLLTCKMRLTVVAQGAPAKPSEPTSATLKPMLITQHSPTTSPGNSMLFCVWRNFMSIKDQICSSGDSSNTPDA